MKRDKLVFYFTLLAFFAVISSCSKEDVYNITPSGVKSDFTVAVSDLKLTGTGNAVNSAKVIWTFGDGKSSTELNPVHVYDPAINSTHKTDYVVQLTAFGAEGAVSFKERKITIDDPRPVSYFKYVLDELALTVKDSSYLTSSHLWDFGNKVTSTLASPTTVFPEIVPEPDKDKPGDFIEKPKEYKVMHTVTNSKGVRKDSVSLTIFPIPVADFTFEIDKNSPSTDPGRVVTFKNTGKNGTDFKWDFGDNTSSTSSNDVHTYNIKFSYKVTLTVSNPRRKVSVTKTVNLN